MPRRFEMADFLALQQPTGRVPLALAPDGALLAISVQPKGHDTTPDADKRFTAAGVPMEAVGSRVLIVDTVTGEAAAPFPPESTSWGGRWSSDGAWLAAYVQHEGPACLGLWRRGMDAVRLVREAQVRPFFGFEVPRWTPDSASAVIKLVPSGGPARAEQSTAAGPAPVTVFSHDPALRPETPALPGFSEVYRCGLAAVDVHSSAVRRLASDWSLSGWEVAPDGHAVAVLRDTGFDQTRQQSYFDLVVLSLSTGEATTIATRIAQEYGVGISWSPDSTQLAYFTAERGQPGRAFTVDALLERGIADPDRLGLMSQSYGGYCTLALLTQTARFKAAVAVAGMTNLTSFYGILSPRGDNPWLGWSESGQGRLGGSLWEQRAAYIENSPLFYFDRVETPLLLVSGTASPGEAAQAGEAYSALRRLGKRVELRLYDGEDHWPGFWAAANYRDFAERVVSWFGEHLAAPAASAPHDISPL
jgi:dienelactone hydrolase